MRPVRLLVFVFVLLLTACGACAALFPLMRRRGMEIGGHTAEITVYLWYQEVKYRIDKDHYSTRTYHRANACPGFRTSMMSSAALDVVGCGFATVVCLLAAAHLCARRKFEICCSIMVLALVTFAFFAASVATTVFVFCTDTCVNDATKRVRALRDSHFALAEGFIVLCVAAGGFLICTVLEVFT